METNNSIITQGNTFFNEKFQHNTQLKESSTATSIPHQTTSTSSTSLWNRYIEPAKKRLDLEGSAQKKLKAASFGLKAFTHSAKKSNNPLVILLLNLATWIEWSIVNPGKGIATGFKSAKNWKRSNDTTQQHLAHIHQSTLNKNKLTEPIPPDIQGYIDGCNDTRQRDATGRVVGAGKVIKSVTKLLADSNAISTLPGYHLIKSSNDTLGLVITWTLIARLISKNALRNIPLVFEKHSNTPFKTLSTNTLKELEKNDPYLHAVIISIENNKELYLQTAYLAIESLKLLGLSLHLFGLYGINYWMTFFLALFEVYISYYKTWNAQEKASKRKEVHTQLIPQNKQQHKENFANDQYIELIKSDYTGYDTAEYLYNRIIQNKGLNEIPTIIQNIIDYLGIELKTIQWIQKDPINKEMAIDFLRHKLYCLA